MSDPAKAGRLAALHATSFTPSWDIGAFEALLDQAGVVAIEDPDGFILLRSVADEAEVLTLAVRPSVRSRGLGARLVREGCAEVERRGATRLFLEVAEDNAAARALYARVGFVEAGRRPGYYARQDGPRQDGLILALNFPGALP